MSADKWANITLRVRSLAEIPVLWISVFTSDKLSKQQLDIVLHKHMWQIEVKNATFTMSQTFTVCLLLQTHIGYLVKS